MQRYFMNFRIGVLILISIGIVLAEVGAENKRYNVLSIGSQSYHGILTAKTLDYMEMKAYLIAKNHDCLGGQERKHEKIAMTELFDYFGGSETGAIIGATLLIKNDD